MKRVLTLAVLLMALASLLAACATPSQEQINAAATQAAAAVTAIGPTAEAIARWIVELDSDVFDNRENATLKLVEAGAAAVEPAASGH